MGEDFDDFLNRRVYIFNDHGLISEIKMGDHIVQEIQNRTFETITSVDMDRLEIDVSDLLLGE